MKGQINLTDGLVVDLFAGGGGASTGIEFAIGRPVDIAINHDPASIEMHKRNHPYTKHYCEDVWEVNPVDVVNGRNVDILWVSPTCTHFSKAKGAVLLDKKIRSLAWVAVRWAATVKPRVIFLENVEEFQTWGPLKDGRPDIDKRGRTFGSFIRSLKNLGYAVEWKELKACDYGAPTIRNRLFLVARCDGQPIVFPEPTHGPGLIPYRTAGEIIDWTIATKSIFGRKKPLVENTMRRIARGLKKFVLEDSDPFITRNSAPYLIQYHSETTKHEVRGQGMKGPLMTIDTQPRYGMTIANLCVLRNNMDAKSMNEPLSTITTSPGHFAQQINFLSEYYGNGQAVSLKEPLHTITTKERNALISVRVERIAWGNDLKNWPEVRELLNQYCDYVIKDDEIIVLRIDGVDYFISDIGLRMLEPKELYSAQGFPPDYIIDFEVNGKSYSKKDQVARCGNSVCPAMAEALARANVPGLCGRKISTMAELEDEIAI